MHTSKLSSSLKKLQGSTDSSNCARTCAALVPKLCCAHVSFIIRASKTTSSAGSGGSTPGWRHGSRTPSSVASSPSAKSMHLAGCKAMTSSIESPTPQTAIAPMLVDVCSARSDSADAFQTRTRTGQ
eukprot:4187761-Pleurochrysis_carterae.AAC.1